MSPIELLDMIPSKVRKAMYGIIGLAFTVESTLDGFGAGVLDARPQGIAIAVLSALGFGTALRHVTPTPPEG